MHAGRSRIGHLESPIREDRGADLEVEGRPFDAMQKIDILHTRIGCFTQSQCDLSLHADVWPSAEWKGASRLQVDSCCVVEIIPNRPRNAVTSPCGSVGEANLPADNALTASLPSPSDLVDDPIRILKAKSRKSL